MNQDVKRLWTDALRSGQYQQGTGALRKNDRYCCLGVLCELAVNAKVVQSKQSDDNRYGEYYYGRVGYWEGGILPPQVVNWAELDRANPEVDYTSPSGRAYRSGLAGVNDNLVPFNIIADLIEEQL